MTRKIFKSKIFYIVLLMLGVLISLCFAPTSTVSAAGNRISETDMDSILFYKLQDIAGGTLRDNTLYDKGITELDLSFVATGAVSSANKITSIEGLELLDLRKITVLKLNNQNISEISETNLSGMPNLERLELNGNALVKVNVSHNAKLKVFLADNNYLETIDLSVVDTSGFETSNSVISLNNNNFNSISDITLPALFNKSKLTVNLENNNILDANTENLDYTLNLGLQGFKCLNTNKNIITTNQEIKFYGFENSAISAKIYSVNQNVKTFVKEFKNGETSALPYTLNVGNYAAEFYINDEKLTDENNSGVNYYSHFEFVVQPPKPTYYYIIDGEKVTNVNKLTEKAILVIESDDSFKTYYKVDNGDWQEGNEISLTEGGKYPIALKAVSGNFESEITNIYINASPNLYLNEGFLILIIALIAALFVIAFVLLKKYVLDK